MLSVSFLSVMIVFLVIIYFKSKWARKSAKHRQELDQFSCPFPSLPIVGNCYAFAGEPTRLQTVLRKWIGQFGGIFYIWWLFDEPTFIITDPAILKIILSSSTQIEKWSRYEDIGKVLGQNNLIVSPGHQWQKDRKLLGQAFRKRHYFEQVLKESNKEMDRLLSEIHKNESSLNKGEYIDHHKVIEPIAMKIAFELLAGIELSYETIHRFENRIPGLLDIARVLLSQPWVGNNILWRMLGYKKALEGIKEDFSDVMKKIKEERDLAKSQEILQENSPEKRITKTRTINRSPQAI